VTEIEGAAFLSQERPKARTAETLQAHTSTSHFSISTSSRRALIPDTDRLILSRFAKETRQRQEFGK